MCKHTWSIKIIVNAFLKCVTDGLKQSLPMGKLVPELVCEVVRHLGPPSFEKYAKNWDALLACCNNYCRPTAFLSQEELEALARKLELRAPWDKDDLDEEFKFQGEHSEKHHETQEDMLQRVGKSVVEKHLREDTFVEYNKILEQDFGLQVYFTVCQRRHGGQGDSEVNILAHLIRPSQHQALFPCSGMQVCSSSTAMILDPAVLQLPYSTLEFQFTYAMSCLHLSLDISHQHTQPSQSTMSPLSQERQFKNSRYYGSTRDLNQIRFQLLQKEDSNWPKLMILSQLRLKTANPHCGEDVLDSEDEIWDY
ncbi:hypothetical protein MMC18_005269 [Xylographa bjoerkii]|nr:hypothetical protein [Xylographa bjoerkii]